MYLAVVLDVFSRKVVGWAMRTHLLTELVLSALNMALAARHPPLRPRHAVHLGGFRSALRGGWGQTVDGLGGRLL